MNMKFCWVRGDKVIEVKSISNSIIDYALLLRDNEEEILLLGELPEVESLQQLEDIFFQHYNKGYKIVGSWSHQTTFKGDAYPAFKAYESLPRK